ncbi:metallophosphoesterase family protein [Spirosoma fluviale]|uniref:3',5'-cyclic AMP phosphodiesterase CpdA n=1 Tax=Spirosoma fluviale TaxID=1597977 RepID=A0A286F447_9BACT|nr:metallophosphoesterase [Spirosoma fluviale]SOD78007.1 3',5'-cyclic AMP phosphodiesterase CpdA [Spirosoma fluviale]
MNRRDIVKQMGAGLAALSVRSRASAQAKTPPRQRVLRVAHLTDVHMQPIIGAAKGFEKCLHHVQSLPDKPDLIINGGDAIMEAHGRGKDSVNRQWRLYQDVLRSENTLSVLSCVGNHDIWCKQETKGCFEAGRQWAMDEFQMTKRFYSIDRNGWRIIMLDSVQPKADGSWYTAHLDDEQYHWLESELKTTPSSTPILVVSHIPILAACVFFDGQRFADENWSVPARWMHSDTVRLTNLFHNHPNVKAALSGHIHLTDRVDYNGVSYYCNGAVSGAWWFGNYHHTAAGYALVDLYDDGTVENRYVNYV